MKKNPLYKALYEITEVLLKMANNNELTEEQIEELLPAVNKSIGVLQDELKTIKQTITH